MYKLSKAKLPKLKINKEKLLIFCAKHVRKSFWGACLKEKLCSNSYSTNNYKNASFSNFWSILKQTSKKSNNKTKISNN
jgi:hypothetical protein